MSGKSFLQSRALGVGLAGALLAELVFAGALWVKADQLQLNRQGRPGDYLERQILSLLVGERDWHPLRDWLLYLSAGSEHVAWWRMRVSYAGAVLGLGGWVILGWAVPWPAVLPAAIALQAALTALSWAIEASCDLGAARTAGPAAMMEALARADQVAEAARAARPAWQRSATSILTWITGPAHPPFPVRRALIRTLLRHQTDTTA